MEAPGGIRCLVCYGGHPVAAHMREVGGFKYLIADALQRHAAFEPNGTYLTSERDARVSGEETWAD